MIRFTTLRLSTSFVRSWASLALLGLLLLSPASSALGASTWSSTGGMTTARWQHTATLLPSGKVLVTGGLRHDTASSTLSSVEIYNAATATWSGATPMSQARYAHTATLLTNGTVLVAGGNGNMDSAGSITATASAEIYDPAMGAWTATGSMLQERSGHTATLLANGTVLVTGANTTNAEIYDPATGAWRPTGSLTQGRSQYTATLLANGTVLVVGGLAADRYDFLAGAELFDPSSESWRATGAIAMGRAAHTATLLKNGKVLVAGGYDFCQCSRPDADLFDPATETWRSAGAMPVGMALHTATLLTDGKVLAAGGVESPRAAVLYDPVTGTWSVKDSMTTDHSLNTATALASGNVLVVGGRRIDSQGQYVASASAEIYSNVRQIVRIEAGGRTSFTDHDGDVWLSDRGFTGGSIVDRGNISISKTLNPKLYQTERYGMKAFTCDLPSGVYRVDLHFAETYGGINRAGQRVFNVNVEGTSINNIDVYAQAGGRNRALVKTVIVTVRDGRLNISFTASANQPEINAIQISEN